jgi:hypothetical protein
MRDLTYHRKSRSWLMTMMIIMNKKNKGQVVRGLTFIRGTRDNLLFRRFPGFVRSSFAERDIICNR